MVDDVSLTCTRADVAVLAWLLTWIDDVSNQFSGAWNARDSVTGAWRRSQKPGRRVSARVSSFAHQIFRPSRSGDDKAVLAARVAEIQARSQERSAARVRVLRLPMEVECLGFVDRWTRRPSWRRVYQEHDLEVRNLRRRVGDFPETTEACEGAWQGFG